MAGTVSKSGSKTMSLPRVLDLTAAEELLAMLRQAAGAGAGWGLDASAVETLTSPCAQILLAATRTVPGIVIYNPTPAFLKGLSDLGLELNATISTADISATPENAPSETAPAAAKRILTIDDSKTIRDMLRLTLIDAGYDVLQAVDGEDGLDVLERETVDVVITDINMPRLDGYGVLREMRRQPEYKSMPILVLTTENNTEKKNLAREAGATGWMVKPFDPEQLLATIRRVSP